MMHLSLPRLCVSGLLALLVGCAGYGLQVGSSGFGEFQQVYAIPASSLTPWAERSAPAGRWWPRQQHAASGAHGIAARTRTVTEFNALSDPAHIVTRR